MIYNKLNLKIAEFASTDEMRPAINGVLLENKKTTATDGHILVEVDALPWDLDEFPKCGAITKPIKLDHNRIMPTSLALNLAKGIKRSSIPILECITLGDKTNKEQTEVVYTDLETSRKESFRNSENPYPDTREVKPKGKPVFETCFSPKLLSKIFKFLDQANITRVQMEFFDNKGCHCLRIKTESGDTLQKIYALVMGMTIGTDL